MARSFKFIGGCKDRTFVTLAGGDMPDVMVAVPADKTTIRVNSSGEAVPQIRRQRYTRRILSTPDGRVEFYAVDHMTDLDAIKLLINRG